VAVTEHVPLPLVIVRVAAVTVHAVDDPTEYVTLPVPLPPVVDKVYTSRYAPVEGATTVSADCVALVAATLAVTVGAALKFALPGCDAATPHAAVLLVIVTTPAEIEQPPDTPTVTVRADVEAATGLNED